jgi:hypothetical protein
VVVVAVVVMEYLALVDVGMEYLVYLVDVGM